ncbi:hypothetical protein E2C01_073810 [Portunus trituberculatus]|uniref:Uncharacterized protein n=1 Tax=Portunus trituberculatus TaxID=210409 RepID=A0A5B7IAG7_PORTR|nr:hypothetical protein [Portunus trituberculatus]
MVQTAGRRRQAQHKAAGTAVWRAAGQQQVRAAEPHAAARCLLAASAGKNNCPSLRHLTLSNSYPARCNHSPPVMVR